MSPPALQRAHLVAAVVFVAGVLALTVQLLTPSPVVVSVGENGTQATTIGQYFTYTEAAVVAVTAAACGGSGTFLLLYGRGRTSEEQAQRPANLSGRRMRTAGDGGVATGGGRPETAGGSDGSEAVGERWQATLDRLANNEETIYELLVDADGELPQRTLVEETDLSKATVSRTLDTLEQRGLVERRRDGMGNTVLLT
jgi:uncharacterized membrane protein